MSIIDIIPTSDNLMSVYTLVTFAIYTIILGVTGKFAVNKFNKQETSIEKLATSISVLGIEVAVLNERMGNVEDGMSEIKNSISMINQTLLDRLPRIQ